MKNSNFAKEMLSGILRQLKHLPMKRATDWIMGIIKDRVELNIEVFGNTELTIRLCNKSIADLNRIPDERQQTDYGIELLREKFGLIIHLVNNPDEEYQNGGGSNKFRTATKNQNMDGGKQQIDNE